MKFMIEKTLETKSGIVHYWISETINPEKTNLFFLHGLTASHELFEKQIEHFSKNYNVIAWDAPAHGASRPFEDFKGVQVGAGSVDGGGVTRWSCAYYEAFYVLLHTRWI